MNVLDYIRDLLKSPCQLLLYMSLMTSTSVSAQWEVLSEKSHDGKDLMIAEQVGDGGVLFSFVCLNKTVHLEVGILDATTLGEPGAAFLFRVDNKDPIRIGGFTERVNRDILVFFGLDIRDKPAAATQKLFKHIRHGNRLFWIAKSDVSDELLSLEEWDLNGSRKALDEIVANCPDA